VQFGEQTDAHPSVGPILSTGQRRGMSCFNLAKTLAERGHEVVVATQRMVDVPDRGTLGSRVRVHRFARAAMPLPDVYSINRTYRLPLPDPLGVRELSRITRLSHVCATKRLMRMGSVCEGPTVARCLPCATANYGPAVRPQTVAATAMMRPWKNRTIDHVVCVSNAVASGNHIPRDPNTYQGGVGGQDADRS
jgi:hypothetical protein